MPQTSQDVSQRIQSQLKVLLPDLSMDPLTIERKMVDTFSEVISDASVDQYLLNYQFDIDTKFGSDLDKFVALFGFARQAGHRAAGTVTFSRGTPAEEDILIAAGTQVVKPATSVTPLVTFQTTSAAVLPTGAISVEVPVECVTEGPLGNVAAQTISIIGTGTSSDISAVTNENATTGGFLPESDLELRIRFRNTIFRNIAGTKDQYLALAIASRFANKANVIGPISRFIEYIQIEPDLTIASEIPYSKYTYNFDYYLTNGITDAEVFYSPGVDYTFTNSVPPSISVINSTTLPVGDVVLLEHAYCSRNSRNDPTSNITNFVDVYVSGQDATAATESLQYPTVTFNNTTGSPTNIVNYTRYRTGESAAVGNRFQQLIWQPVIDIPDVITIDGTDYYEGTHYWLIRDTSVYKGSRRARNGIEWASIVGVTPGTEFVLDYTFNKLAILLNELMESHKQITTDVLVHTATERYLILNLIVMYTAGFSKTSVDAAIYAAVSNFFERQQFGAVIQISDILEIVHEVPGVDNVRIATPADGVAYGVQEVAGDGTTPIGLPYTSDFALQDSDLPVLDSIVAVQRSQNTWQ